MTRRHFYLFALWLPLIVPLIVVAGDALLRLFSWHQSSFLSEFLAMSLALGGVQYAVFAILLSFWGWHKNAQVLSRAGWVLPLLYVPFFLLGILALFLSSSSFHLMDIKPGDVVECLSISGFFAVFCLITGYAYVLLVHSLTWLLQKTHFIKD